MLASRYEKIVKLEPKIKFRGPFEMPSHKHVPNLPHFLPTGHDARVKEINSVVATRLPFSKDLSRSLPRTPNNWRDVCTSTVREKKNKITPFPFCTLILSIPRKRRGFVSSTSFPKELHPGSRPHKSGSHAAATTRFLPNSSAFFIRRK
ncbi:unnamed protein product [Ixodes pacificus]